MPESRPAQISRRSFLIGTGAAAGTLALSMCRLGERQAPDDPISSVVQSAARTESIEPIRYGDFQDVWRERWQWDKVVHSSHTRANCISTCSWNIFVKDGIAWREEQNAIYGHAEGAPDFNPRGCQKGACFTHVMYEGSRVLHPLRRAGERGSGHWKRASWDEVLTEIADAIIDTSVANGTGTVVYDHGTTNIDFGPDTCGEMRLFNGLNSAVIDSWAGVGDLPYGTIQTWGMYNSEGTSDDWFKSDFIIIWVGNPVVTRMPEVHFMLEARYRGAKLVTIAPEYSPSSIHADYWLNPRVGTDAALALAMAQVILKEGLHDEEYVREQTDLPILVRDDNGRYLRESDLRRRGSAETLYFWDEARDQPAVVPGCVGQRGRSLALGGLRPALAGRHGVRLSDGSEVTVRPMLEGLRERLDAENTPERAAAETGLSAATIRRVARELAGAPRAMIYSSWGACKHYHSDLAQRAKCLLMALTGNQGKSGGGLRVSSWWPIEGFDELSRARETIPFRVKMKALWKALLGRGGLGWRDFESLMQRVVPHRGYTPLMPWLYVHAGYSEIWDRSEWQDPAVPRPTSAYMKEAIDKGWIPIRPRPGTDPKVFIFTGPNPLRRWPSGQIAHKHLWPKLDLIVDVNFKVSTSGILGDIILPTAGYYERDSIKYSQAYLPYIVLCEKAVEPLGESKPEWEIFGLLARRVQERARQRGISRVKDGGDGEVDLSTVYDGWSRNGKFHESDSMSALEYLLSKTKSTGGVGFAEASKTGLMPIVDVSDAPHPLLANGSTYFSGRTYYPHASFIEKKEVWPTLSGRQQFLIDHPWYEEIGEVLPVFKEPPKAGGDYPLRLTGGHTRWSIHATWRDNALMLRMQRGRPAFWMSSVDAEKRGIRDGDTVRVFNDNGAFEAVARLTPTLQPGQIHMYHAWEPYQFKNWKGQAEPVPSPWKALHLAGGYGQIHYRMIYGAPSHAPRGATVEVERVARG